ncbi:MAG TPA: glycosyltransferase, partial [Ignavibacteriaceae bacterium]
FLIEPVYEAVRKLKLDIPIYTIVTDPFTAHPMWFLRKDQRFIVFSERLKQTLSAGIEKGRVEVFPFILEEKFSQPIPASAVTALKREMGFMTGKKIILMLGGGDGIPHGRAILEKLLKTNPDAEIAVVCGRDKSLYNAAIKLKENYPDISLKVYEFVSFVYELLNISDVVITKCGASTIMEILILTKVPVVNDYIWEQEKGNIDFVQDNGLGIYERNIARMPAELNRLIRDEEYYRSFRKNIENLKLKNGVSDVAEYLLKEE